MGKNRLKMLVSERVFVTVNNSHDFNVDLSYALSSAELYNKMLCHKSSVLCLHCGTGFSFAILFCAYMKPKG